MTTQEIPLFPLNTVLFPGMALPLHIFEERYKRMVSECVRDSHPFGVVLIRSGEEVEGEATIYDVGTTAHITQVENVGDGRMNIATLGYSRFKVSSTHNRNPYLTGIVEDFPLLKQDSIIAKKLAKMVSPLLQNYLNIFATLGNIEIEMESLPEEPLTLAFLTAIILRTDMRDKQRLLDVPDLVTLLQIERQMLQREAQILKMLIDDSPRWRDDNQPFSLN